MINKYILVFVCALVFAFSCKKKEKCEGGTNGTASVKAVIKHHTTPIYNQSNYLDTVYVKYNSLESPGSSLSSYDSYFVGKVGDDFVTCNNLKCGNYYFLASGFDTTTNERVFGGISFNIPEGSIENYNLNIAVVE